MKTLKSIVTGLALLIICGAANAAVKPITANRLSEDDVVSIYIDAVAHGDISGLDNVLDDSLHYDIKRGDEVKVLHKYQLMEFLKGNPVDPSVKTSSAIVQQGNDLSVVKVNFKYANYTRTDMVTLDDEGGWMITKIVSTYS